MSRDRVTRLSLKSARVCVAGIGGTGSAVATGLVAAGVGRVHMVDFDHVEESNLTRQLLFTEHDIGRLKVDVAVERLRAINSLIDISGENRRITGPEDIVALMNDCDIYVLCADSPVKKMPYWTNTGALRTRTLWYMAVYEGPTVTITALAPGVTGCWACLRHERDAAEFVAEGRPLMGWPPSAVVSATANVAGQMCALEIVAQLSGMPTQVLGRTYRHNLACWDNRYYLDIPHFDDCSECGNVSVEHRRSERKG